MQLLTIHVLCTLICIQSIYMHVHVIFSLFQMLHFITGVFRSTSEVLHHLLCCSHHWTLHIRALCKMEGKMFTLFIDDGITYMCSGQQGLLLHVVMATNTCMLSYYHYLFIPVHHLDAHSWSDQQLGPVDSHLDINIPLVGHHLPPPTASWMP